MLLLLLRLLLCCILDACARRANASMATATGGGDEPTKCIHNILHTLVSDMLHRARVRIHMRAVQTHTHTHVDARTNARNIQTDACTRVEPARVSVCVCCVHAGNTGTPGTHAKDRTMNATMHSGWQGRAHAQRDNRLRVISRVLCGAQTEGARWNFVHKTGVRAIGITS